MFQFSAVIVCVHSMHSQANPRLATRRDEDDRLALHWALSNNRTAIVELLSERDDFDPDTKVRGSQ